MGRKGKKGEREGRVGEEMKGKGAEGPNKPWKWKKTETNAPVFWERFGTLTIIIFTYIIV